MVSVCLFLEKVRSRCRVSGHGFDSAEPEIDVDGVAQRSVGVRVGLGRERPENGGLEAQRNGEI